MAFVLAFRGRERNTSPFIELVRNRTVYRRVPVKSRQLLRASCRTGIPWSLFVLVWEYSLFESIWVALLVFKFSGLYTVLVNRRYRDGANNVGIKGRAPTVCHSLLACKLYAVAMATGAIQGRNPGPKFAFISPSSLKSNANTSNPNNSKWPYHNLNDHQIHQVTLKDNRLGRASNINGKPDLAFNGILARRPLHLLLLLRSGC